MKVAVIGTGHVGLITGVALASLGNEVTGMDLDAREGGDAPGRYALRSTSRACDDLLREGVEAGRLRFTTSIAEAVAAPQVVFICVGRPPVGQGDRSLTAVEDAAREIASAATDGVVHGGEVHGASRHHEPASNGWSAWSGPICGSRRSSARSSSARATPWPTRWSPIASCWAATTRTAIAVLRELYAPVLEGGRTVIETDARTAELSKLASNAFLATKISFANSLARVSELAGADVEGVSEIMGADPRIGQAFLGAGLGYGGYCLPKDIVTLERVADRLGYDFGILREATRVNEEAITAVVGKVEEAIWNVEGKTVALFGLAFKPGTDDTRASPALALADGAQIARGLR